MTEIASTGTAAGSSPASATKAAALSRAASVKRASSSAARGGLRPRNELSAPRRKSESPSLSRTASSNSSNGNQNGSASNGELEMGSGLAEELARLSREQLLALVSRERSDKDEVGLRLRQRSLVWGWYMSINAADADSCHRFSWSQSCRASRPITPP